MFRKLLFNVLAAVVLAGGVLLTNTVVGDANPILMSPAPQVQVNGGVLDVRQNCGWWNNWCRPTQRQCGRWNNWCGRGDGGDRTCINLGGVQFCVNGSGTDCHWYNNRRYCDNGRRPDRGQQCVNVNGRRYCDYNHRGDCIRVNRRTYCRY